MTETLCSVFIKYFHIHRQNLHFGFWINPHKCRLMVVHKNEENLTICHTGGITTYHNEMQQFKQFQCWLIVQIIQVDPQGSCL